MSNILRDLARQNEVAGTALANALGLPQARVYRAIKKGDDIPPMTDWRDIKAIAGFFGKRVIITLEPLDNGGEVKNEL